MGTNPNTNNSKDQNLEAHNSKAHNPKVHNPKARNSIMISPQKQLFIKLMFWALGLWVSP